MLQYGKRWAGGAASKGEDTHCTKWLSPSDKELLQLLSLPSTITLCPAGSDWYSLTTSAGLFSTRQSHLAPSGFDSCQSSYSSAITNSCSWQVTETHCWKGLGSVGLLLFQTFTFFPPCKHCSFLLSREWGGGKKAAGEDLEHANN